METKIIDGKKIASDIRENIKKEISKLSFKPIFCDVLIGNDPASVQYVHIKKRIAEEVGISFHEASFSESITTDELIIEIKKLNTIENICGIIIQLPLPEHIDRRKVLDTVDSKFDVDCLGQVASDKFYKGEKGLGYPTALACIAILDSLNIDLKTKKIVVLGQGMLVGKPVTALLQFRDLSPVPIRSNTENKEEIIKNADVIISGMGKGKYITGDMIKKGAVLIDAGTFELEGGIVGDVDFESVKGIAEYVSPVPGGVGPVTVAMLLNNVLTVAKNHAYE